MIEGFRHRGLKRLYERGDQKAFRSDHVAKVRRILARLDEAQNVQDMDLPGFGLHHLTGNYAGFWAVWVSRNWRIIFRFEDSCAFDVDFLDYH